MERTLNANEARRLGLMLLQARELLLLAEIRGVAGARLPEVVTLLQSLEDEGAVLMAPDTTQDEF